VVDGSGQLVWKDTKIGNVWTQAVIPATKSYPATIIVTEAGGSVRLYNAQGQSVHTLRPMGQYVSSFEAADVDGNNNIQIACESELGQTQAVCFVIDTVGNILWKTETQLKQRHAPTNLIFSHGDLDGDGVQDWAFLHKTDELVVISGKTNQLLTTLPVSSLIKQFAIITRPGQPGLLCVLEVSRLILYEPHSQGANP